MIIKLTHFFDRCANAYLSEKIDGNRWSLSVYYKSIEALDLIVILSSIAFVCLCVLFRQEIRLGLGLVPCLRPFTGCWTGAGFDAGSEAGSESAEPRPTSRAPVR